MRARLPLPVLALLFIFTLSAATPAAAQFGKLKDKVKNKVERKVDQKTDQAIDKTIDGAVDGVGKDGEAPAPADPAEPATPGAGGDKAAAPAAGGTAVAEDMTLYTKYDFVPGDKVIFYDDLAKEELGEFPSRWNLDRGVFEIARAEGHTWILNTDHGYISPKLAPGPLPDKYTVEMQFFANGDKDGWYYIHWLDANGDKCGYLRIGYSNMTTVVINDKTLANKDLPQLQHGVHTMRIMATKSTIKCYIDQERVANVPKVEGFAPVGFVIEMDPYYENNNVCRIGSFRFAEGGKSLREQLDESGRIVTHGILFDSGSDRIKAESFKTLIRHSGGDAPLSAASGCGTAPRRAGIPTRRPDPPRPVAQAFTENKPSPLPSGLVVTSAENSSARRSGGTPGPLSWTSITTALSSPRTRTSMMPFSPAACAALSTRLPTSWCMSTGLAAITRPASPSHVSRQCRTSWCERSTATTSRAASRASSSEPSRET
jgi:OOP family OmpA-OmpF porin